ncbi:MAG: hypothetical protein M3O06_12195, partial [Pseudomonadota bacterium]|nr:hypothetical protein [Pseudomonadota bacterium]
MAAAMPYLAAAGAVYQGAASANASKYNAQVAANEQKSSIDQANQQENLVRRSSRESLGKQAAAFGAAGVGYGGSSATALDQSAVNQEMDALNTRYKGAITAYGYGAKSKLDQSQANSESVSTGLLAGNALMKGMSSNYSMAPA